MNSWLNNYENDLDEVIQDQIKLWDKKIFPNNESAAGRKFFLKKMESIRNGVKIRQLLSEFRSEWEMQIEKMKPKVGCFVATVTMGDYNHPTVLQLRNFRDSYLLQRNWGRIFTKFYYKWGQYPAHCISKRIIRRKISYYLIIKPLEIIVAKYKKRGY